MTACARASASGLLASTMTTLVALVTLQPARTQPTSLWPPTAPPAGTAVPASVAPMPSPAQVSPAEDDLRAARVAIQDWRLSDAQAGLNQAETTLRQVPPGSGGGLQAERALLDIGVARRAVAARDQAGALQAIDDALVVVRTNAAVAPAAGGARPPPAPMVTYAWLAGHWAPQGSGFVWVPPNTVGRLVVGRTWVPEGWVWRGGQYVWMPAHWEN